MCKINGNIYREYGTYLDTFRVGGSCDSIFYYDIYLGVNDTAIINLTACIFDTIIINGNRFTRDTSLFLLTNRIDLCDSITNFIIRFTPAPAKIENYSICLGDTLRIRGRTYFSSGTFYDTFITTNLCDTIFLTPVVAIVDFLC